jgi:hypothetical protein
VSVGAQIIESDCFLNIVRIADMLQLLSQAPNIQAATAELAAIRKEIEEMKKREDVDEVD